MEEGSKKCSGAGFEGIGRRGGGCGRPPGSGKGKKIASPLEQSEEKHSPVNTLRSGWGF